MGKETFNHHGGKPDPEELDETPLEIPAGATVPMSLNEMIAKFVRQEVESERSEDMETWEEADDFEPEDEALLDLSAYTLQDLPDEVVDLPEDSAEDAGQRPPLSPDPDTDPGSQEPPESGA